MTAGVGGRAAHGLLVLVMLLAGCGGGDAAGGGRGAGSSVTAELSVLEDAGDVEQADGQAVPANDVDVVVAGQTLSTDTTGLLELGYADGSLTRVGPESRFTLVELSDEAESAEITVQLDVGRTWHRVSEGLAGGERFSVRTSVATAAVRGTAFSVVCERSDTCVFAVFEGEVAVLVDGVEVVVLTAGQEVSVGPGGAGEVRQLTAADIVDDDWYRGNLERDDLDVEGSGAPDDGDGGSSQPPASPGDPRGTVTLAGMRWDFVPDVQCLILDDGTQAHVAWSGEGDPSVEEIVFDIFGPDDESMRIQTPDNEWFAEATDIEVTVDGGTAAGTALVEALFGGEQANASFEFTCP